MVKKLMGSEVEYNVHVTDYPEDLFADWFDDPEYRRNYLANYVVPELLVREGSPRPDGISPRRPKPSVILWFRWGDRSGSNTESEQQTSHIRESWQRFGISGWRLFNGARFYVDNFFPEYSTPECLSLKDLIAHEKAGERILQDASRKLLEAKGIGTKIFKKNSDRQGASYACHENYLLSRPFFDRLVREVGDLTKESWIFATFLVTRQIFTGSGKVGSDSRAGERIPYQLSQRADFMERLSGIETTFRRSIINLRDTPYADARRYGRLHVIIGDSNMAEYSIFLKMGTTAMVLEMLEDEWMPAALSRFILANPVSAVKTISRDIALSETLLTKEGRRARALEVQWAFLEACSNWYRERYCENHGRNSEYEEVLNIWASTLEALGRDPESLSDTLDCWIKKRLVEKMLEEEGYSLEDVRTNDVAYDLALSTDFLYHSINEEESYYAALVREGFVRRLLLPEDIEMAIVMPPHDTRAYLRSTLISYLLFHVPDVSLYASWHGVYASTFSDALLKVSFRDPLRGTKEDAEYVFGGNPTLTELKKRLEEVTIPNDSRN
jgi:hypothetical protein